MDLSDVYRMFHPTSVQHTFFSEVYGTSDPYLGYKASLSKYKKIEIISCILSDHNALKVECNKKNNSRKYASNWKLNDTGLNDLWVFDEIKEETKSFLKVNENENMTYQNLWDTAKAVLTRKFIAKSSYIKKSERLQINDLMLHLKLLEKQEQVNPKTSKSIEILKNEIETNKKSVQGINKTKS
jgi:hypothetical protein